MHQKFYSIRKRRRPSGEPTEDLRAHTLELLVAHADEPKALVDSKRRALEAQRKHVEAQARSLQDALVRVRALRTALLNVRPLTASLYAVYR